ncbi:IMP dehydrogenase [Candidatus Uhrbacteria bacterium]|nr:IMP dehydrogenase [Candidatus Uhrbacteria bacterium]
MYKQFERTLTFDDVLLVPQESNVLPSDAVLRSHLTHAIELNIPFVSAAMDTVTEHRMAIAMALAGGIGVIHKNFSIEEQVNEVKRVKRFRNGFIQNPVTANPGDGISKIVEIRKEFGYKKIPVVDESGELVGLISDVDYSLPQHADSLVKDRMVPINDLIVGTNSMSLAEAQEMLLEHRLRVLCVVGKNGRLVSIVTRKDIEKNIEYGDSLKNELGQLRVAAAIGIGNDGFHRAEALHKAGADALVVDTAHGHSKNVVKTVRSIKKAFPNQQLIAGNIATAEAALALIKAGVDAVKVGIGPGSICTTRIIAGIGIPQMSAILEVKRGVQRSKRKISLISDGGISSSGDVVKALAAGADCVMMGNMFAGTEESPGRVELTAEGAFKMYRGMGSIEAMERGSKDRYGQTDITEKKKFVPEGVTGRVPYKGPISRILYQLSGGVRSGLGYVGAKTIIQLQKKARFVSISSASLSESHPHNLSRIESAPNYRVDSD